MLTWCWVDLGWYWIDLGGIGMPWTDYELTGLYWIDLVVRLVVIWVGVGSTWVGARLTWVGVGLTWVSGWLSCVGLNFLLFTA